MKNVLRRCFSFTSRERGGTLVLCILVMGITGLRLWQVIKPPVVMDADHSEMMAILDSFEMNRNDGDSFFEQPFPENEVISEPSLFFFDPNSATHEELVRLGIKPTVARTLINYRSKGGRFYIPDDMLRIYGFDTIEYERVAPFIRIRVQEARRYIPDEEPISMSELLELNTADSIMLREFKGIGSVLAARIIKYRALLGGFHRPEQLTEVYGISDSVYRNMKHLVTIDTLLFKKLNVNTALEKDLARHPYIGNYYAKSIVNYRQFVDTVRSFEEMVNNHLIPAASIEKIKPYLSF